MTINKINNKGFVSTKDTENYLEIENETRFTKNLSIQDGITTKYVAVIQGSAEQSFTGSFHSIVILDGNDQILDGGLGKWWNTSSYIFNPSQSELGKVYSFRLGGIIEPTNNNTSNFHFDFEIFGVIPVSDINTHGSASFHRQSEEITFSNKLGAHEHINLNGFFIVDQEMIDNGAAFYGATSGNPNYF